MGGSQMWEKGGSLRGCDLGDVNEQEHDAFKGNQFSSGGCRLRGGAQLGGPGPPTSRAYAQHPGIKDRAVGTACRRGA